MKKFIWIITLLLPLSLLHSQDDPQWYLLNSDDSSLYDNYSTKLLVKSHIPPNPIITSTNNDDIFAITDDGNFVTTRGSNTTSIYNPNDSSYSFEFEGQVKHLYWSDKYDNPRPPKLISVKPSTSNLNIVNSHDFDGNPIFTHQTIIPNRDIMVAIKTDILTNPEPYTLFYNTVTSGNTTESVEGILEVSPSFNNFLPEEPDWIQYKVLLNSIEFEINTADDIAIPPILYFCLRVTEVASNLVSNGTDVKTLDFQLINPIKPILDVRHSEEIRTAHDPNFIQLKGICTCCDFVSYECQVENTSLQAPSTVSITLDLPSSLKPSSLDIHNMHINGVANDEFEKTINGNTIDINFNDINLRKRPFSTDQNAFRINDGIINFRFCVRHDGSIRKDRFVSSEHGNYYLNSVIEGSTMFDSTEYPIGFRPGLSTDTLTFPEKEVFKYITDDPEESCEVCQEECNYFCVFWTRKYWNWLAGIAVALGLFGLGVNARRRKNRNPN